MDTLRDCYDYILIRLYAQRRHTGERLEKMTESIREHGVLEAVLVWLKHDPESDTDIFIILSGHNRVNASKRAGINKVPVRIMENLTETEAAQYSLGKIYLQGEHLGKDAGKAVELLTASADQGNQFAQYALGKLYFMGQDVEQDKEKAIRYFTESAEQGNEYAAFFLKHIPI